MKVYNMRELSLYPLNFFRGNGGDTVGELPNKSAEQSSAPKKPISKVPSLLFDIELEEGQGRKDAEAPVQDSHDQLQFLTESWSDGERQLMEQVEAAWQIEHAEGRQLEADQLAEQLVQRGHSVTVRTALGGGGGCECLRNLRHVFLSVQMQGSSESFLVDPKFKEQFEIAHPTASYSALLQRVQPFFVGTEERLIHLVELLCTEMSAAFRGTGTTLPPWRQAPSMLSKWRPRRSTDERRSPALCCDGGWPPKQAASRGGPFSVSVSANASCPPSGGVPLPPVPRAPQRRSSLQNELGTSSGQWAAENHRSPNWPRQSARTGSPANVRCRATAARTAASLLAVELGDDAKSGNVTHRGGARRIGSQKPRGLGTKAADEEDDSPTSVLESTEEEPHANSLLSWQLRGGFGGHANDAAAMFCSSARGMRQGLVTGL